jgi:nitrogen PTS system EIIA component
MREGFLFMDLKIKDVAELLDVSETTIRRWLSDGKIPGYRLNHQYRFSRSEIENWMIHCKLKPTEEGFSPFREKAAAPLVHESSCQESAGVRGGMQQFGLYRALHQGELFHRAAGRTKEELIRETTKTISSKLSVDADVLSELLLDREKLMPTALNNGIAVPHTRDFLMKEPFDVVVLVFPEEPVEYGALDGNPVHTLFFSFCLY